MTTPAKMDLSSKAPTVKIRPNLSGTQETLLAILQCRLIDARSAKPILNDQYAARIIDQLDYDFDRLGADKRKAGIMSVRAKWLDRWVGDFLQQARQQRQPVTVLHLATGLDTRALRLQEVCEVVGEGQDPLVHWVDVDLPDVVDVRQRLGLPEPEARRMQYRLVGADVTSEGWLSRLDLPRDRSTCIVFEGLTMYLQPAQGRTLLETLTGYFVGGGNQMAFDCINWVTIATQKLEPMLAKTGSRFIWAVNKPREMERWHQGLRLRDEVLATTNSENAKLDTLGRWAFWVCSLIPGLRTMGRFVRFAW
ncbi:hypothetical protein VMCG_05821 [Cytospora schulzeri]|uniref:O-methyltransferase domain-containing protein n=1 Tax=Cytospora schulzeri TaxID=448051 RepID=A0A423WI88_9PEZI|nr:hypothetical protein VMCG_05821 [Valsa malicola]